MIGPMMAVNHWPNQVVLAGASKWTIMFSLFFWHVHIHNDGPMKTARLHFISPNHIIYLQNKSYIYKHFQLLVTIRVRPLERIPF